LTSAKDRDVGPPITALALSLSLHSIIVLASAAPGSSVPSLI